MLAARGPGLNGRRHGRIEGYDQLGPAYGDLLHRRPTSDANGVTGAGAQGKK